MTKALPCEKPKGFILLIEGKVGDFLGDQVCYASQIYIPSIRKGKAKRSKIKGAKVYDSYKKCQDVILKSTNWRRKKGWNIPEDRYEICALY